MADKELKRALLRVLETRLGPNGFRCASGRDYFISRIGDFTRDFHMAWLEYETIGWRVQPGVGLRSELVEGIFHQISGFAKEHQSRTATVGTFVGQLLANDNRACQFEFNSAAEVGPVADGIMQVFERIALPFYQRFSDLRAIDAAVNDHPLERCVVRGGPVLFRGSTGLIVAKLVGRANYEELVTIYREQMTRGDRGFYLSRFEALVTLLADVHPLPECLAK